MTPKEKAKDIFFKYTPDLVNELGLNDHSYELNKKFASITASVILSLNIKFNGREIDNNLVNINYWQDVKLEIEKL